MGFGYDANGRMVKATKANVPDALSVYDAAGMRVAERVNDIWRFSVYDIGGKIVAEYGGVPATDEGGVKYLLSDWQGSNRAVVSNGGFVKARIDYTAYGKEIASGVGMRTPALGYSATSADSLRQRYGLTERDEATGLDHTPWRKNENRAGRWTSPDPFTGSASIGDPQSFNRFSYVQGQPTNFIDPSGLFMAGPSQGGGYCVRYHYYNPSTGESFWGDWHCSSNGGGEGGVPASLNPKELKKLNKAMRKIQNALQREKCKKFLEDHLGKDIISKILTNLAAHQAFSGPRSTEISVVDAGIYSPTERARLETLIQNGGPASEAARYSLNRSVAQYFEDMTGPNREINAAVGNYLGNPNTAFYNNFPTVTILHENLHISTGLDDNSLATALGIDISSFNGDYQLASAAISKKLKEEGCTK